MLEKFKYLKKHQSFMKYFKNTLWLFFERIIKMGIGFFIIILLTRYLGPENYGLLSYSQSLIGIFIAFSTLGLEVVLVRELTKRKSETDVILGTAFILAKSLVNTVLAVRIVLVCASRRPLLCPGRFASN
jgi:O-antigen/teichoic acid export membrane protein